MARCLYCGKTLWLRLSSRGSEFCGEEHRRQYDELVLARLQADEEKLVVPAETGESLPEPEPAPEAGSGETEVEDEQVPVVAGFRQGAPMVALAPKSQARLPAGVRQNGIVWRLPAVRRCARPVPARVLALRVSPPGGVLQPRPAIVWKLPLATVAVRRVGARAACAPQAANLREVHFAFDSGTAEGAPVLPICRWTWRGVLPIHSGSVIGPVVREMPRPARLIRLRVDSQVLAPAHRHLPIRTHTALTIPAPRLAVSAAMLPAPPHRVPASPHDSRARSRGLNITVAKSPIALPRLKARPAGFPVPRREEMVWLGEPEPPAMRRSAIAWVRSRWSAAPRLARVAVLVLPLLGASVPLAPRIPQALRSLHWQHPALAHQIESRLQQRAVIEVIEDFRSGLSGWEGRPDWSEGWSYDPAGFVHPGPLAILTASRALSDYRFEFLGLIERKGVGWVFRAADLRNYYAIKIVIVRPGPLPRAVLVRSVVRDDVAVEQARLPLPMTIRIGRFYRIETSAYEDRFVTSIDGRVVDTFFDGRHRAGGVGLFSEPGEDARVMALRVADRDDFLGRVCAYFLGRSADSASEATRSVSRNDPGEIERK